MAEPRLSPAALRATDPAEWSALMRAAQAGDAAAYRRLLEGIVPHLRAHARRALREAADVEDAVQDILLTVHAVRRTYDPARPFAPWLFAIARHRLLDRLRARGRRLARETPLLDSHDAAADVAPPGDPRALRAGLAALPAGQRQAVELLKLREMTLAEAATASGQSIGALKVATHRALKSLRRLLAGREEAP